MPTIDEIKGLASRKLGFARSNNFLVELPSKWGYETGRNLNILCSNVSLPGKQIMTHERRIGMENNKIAYGFANEDVTMTFYLMNDYNIKKYFDRWRSAALNEGSWEINYKSEYQNDIKIHQLRKPLVGYSKSIGPLRIQGNLGGGSVYSVNLLEAFPTQISGIALSNEQDGLVQLTVTFAYTNWTRTTGVQNWIDLDIDTPLGTINIL